MHLLNKEAELLSYSIRSIRFKKPPEKLRMGSKENNYYITDEPEPKDPDYEAESDDLPF